MVVASLYVALREAEPVERMELSPYDYNALDERAATLIAPLAGNPLVQRGIQGGLVAVVSALVNGTVPRRERNRLISHLTSVLETTQHLTRSTWAWRRATLDRQLLREATYVEERLGRYGNMNIGMYRQR
jgi:hypothetical protein